MKSVHSVEIKHDSLHFLTSIVYKQFKTWFQLQVFDYIICEGSVADAVSVCDDVELLRRFHFRTREL